MAAAAEGVLASRQEESARGIPAPMEMTSGRELDEACGASVGLEGAGREERHACLCPAQAGGLAGEQRLSVESVRESKVGGSDGQRRSEGLEIMADGEWSVLDRVEDRPGGMQKEASLAGLDRV